MARQQDFGKSIIRAESKRSDNLYSTHNELKAQMLNRLEQTRHKAEVTRLTREQHICEKQYNRDVRLVRKRSAKMARQAAIFSLNLQIAALMSSRRRPQTAHSPPDQAAKKAASRPASAAPRISISPVSFTDEAMDFNRIRKSMDEICSTPWSSGATLGEHSYTSTKIRPLTASGKPHQRNDPSTRPKSCSASSSKWRKSDSGFMLSRKSANGADDQIPSGDDDTKRQTISNNTGMYATFGNDRGRNEDHIGTFDNTIVSKTSDLSRRYHVGPAQGSVSRPRSVTFFTCDADINHKIRHFLDSQKQFNGQKHLNIV